MEKYKILILFALGLGVAGDPSDTSHVCETGIDGRSPNLLTVSFSFKDVCKEDLGLLRFTPAMKSAGTGGRMRIRGFGPGCDVVAQWCTYAVSEYQGTGMLGEMRDRFGTYCLVLSRQGEEDVVTVWMFMSAKQCDSNSRATVAYKGVRRTVFLEKGACGIGVESGGRCFTPEDGSDIKPLLGVYIKRRVFGWWLAGPAATCVSQANATAPTCNSDMKYCFAVQGHRLVGFGPAINGGGYRSVLESKGLTNCTVLGGREGGAAEVFTYAIVHQHMPGSGIDNPRGLYNTYDCVGNRHLDRNITIIKPDLCPDQGFHADQRGSMEMVCEMGVSERVNILCDSECGVVEGSIECVFSSSGRTSVKSASCGVMHSPNGNAAVSCPLGSEHTVICNGKVHGVDGINAGGIECYAYWSGALGPMGDAGRLFAFSLCKGGVHSRIFLALVIMLLGGAFVVPLMMKLALVVANAFVACHVWATGSWKMRVKLQKLLKDLRFSAKETGCVVCGQECESPAELIKHLQDCGGGICPYCAMVCVEPSNHVPYCKHMVEWRQTQAKAGQEKVVRRRETPSLRRLIGGGLVPAVWMITVVILSLAWAATALEQSDLILITEGRGGPSSDVSPEIRSTAQSEIKDLEVDVGGRQMLILLPVRRGGETIMKRTAKTEKGDVTVVVYISPTYGCSSIEDQGLWCSAKESSAASFACYGSCDLSGVIRALDSLDFQCVKRKDFEFETSWGCNPSNCIGINSGCLGCYVGMVQVQCHERIYKRINERLGRRVCLGIGPKWECGMIAVGTCLEIGGSSFCLKSEGDLLPVKDMLSPTPLSGVSTVLTGVCGTDCKYGEVGDIRKGSDGKIVCPAYSFEITRGCQFGKTPRCIHTSNPKCGLDRFNGIRDGYQTVNITSIGTVDSSTCYEVNEAGGYGEVELTVPASVLDAAIKCKHTVDLKNFKGTWGSLGGFEATCIVTLQGCVMEIEIVSLCTKHECYGAASTHLSGGPNEVRVTGRGGSTFSQIRCCIGKDCSKTSGKPTAPKIFIPNKESTNSSAAINHKDSECGIVCWFTKAGDKFWSLFQTGWEWIALAAVLGLLTLWMARKCLGGRPTRYEVRGDMRDRRARAAMQREEMERGKQD
uniref:Matrix protein n=1 Tax=Stubbeard plunderfish hantavirus TaxID=3138845 RepID=A0AAU7LK93_9VIRU